MDKLKEVREKRKSGNPSGKNHPLYRHGQAIAGKQSPLYKKWMGIKRRCLNKNDKSFIRYGGAGVTVSASWMDFLNFFNDMSPSYFPGASIDRINNNKGYSKDNCRWVTLAEQSKNRRCVKVYKLGDIEMIASDWDKKLGFKEGTVYARLHQHKWSIKKALTTPKDDGVFFDRFRNKYAVEVYWQKKRHFVGRFMTKKEALRARKAFLHSLLVTK